MTQEEHAFSSADEAQLAYRTLSAPAVVGFVLGLLSFLAFLTPYVGLLPWVGAVVSFAAARSVLAAPDSRSGLGLAVTGLFLSVAIGSASYARAVVLDRQQRDEAGEVADEFLSRLRSGDTIGAVELTVAFDERLPTEEAARLYYTTDDAAKKVLQDFVENRAIAALMGESEFALSREYPVRRGRFGRLGAKRRYTAPSGDRPSVLLALERTAPRYEATVAWRVSDFDFAD